MTRYHIQGLTTMELLVGLAITSGVIGGILFAMQTTVRNQSAQSDMMLAETSLRRTQDILSQNIKSGTFALITKADPQGITLEFREKYTFDPTSVQKTGNTFTLTAPDHGENITGQNVIVYNKAGQALLLENPTVIRVAGTLTVSAECQNTIQDIANSTFTFTRGLSIALGRVLGEGFESDTLYTKVGTDNWAAISTKMQAFKIHYVYEALDGSQITDPPEMQTSQTPKDSYSYGGKTYKLSTLIVNTSKTGQANPDLERTYASNIPLARSLMDQVSEISRCTDPTTQPKKGTGDLQVIVQGLPNGVNANLTVNGPGFSQKPTQSKTYYGVNPGSYTLFSSSVTSGLTTYTTAETGGQNADVTPWSPATLTANYQKVQGKLKVTLSGLPNEVTPLLTWNGPENLTTKSWLNGSNPEMSVQPGTYSLTTTGLSYGQRYFNIKTFACSGPSGSCTQGSIPVGSDKTTTVNVTFEERLVSVPMRYTSSYTTAPTTVTVTASSGKTYPRLPINVNNIGRIDLPGGTYTLTGLTSYQSSDRSSGTHIAVVDARSGTWGRSDAYPFQFDPPPPPPSINTRSAPGFWLSVSGGSNIGNCEITPVTGDPYYTTCDAPPSDYSMYDGPYEPGRGGCGGWYDDRKLYGYSTDGITDENNMYWRFRTGVLGYDGQCKYGDGGLYLVTIVETTSGPRRTITHMCTSGPFRSKPPESYFSSDGWGGGTQYTYPNPPTAVSSCPPDWNNGG